MAQHINSIIDIWEEQQSLPEQDKPTVSLDELLYLVDPDGGSNRDVVFTVEQVAAYLAVYGPLAKVVQLFGKATASYAVIKDTLVNGRMPVVVEGGSSGDVSSKRYYLPDKSSIDLRTPSQNEGAFRFYNVDTVEKRVRILIYAEGAESPTEMALSLDYSDGLVTQKVGTRTSTSELFSGFFLDRMNLLMSNQYNTGGSPQTKKIDFKWDDVGHLYEILVDKGRVAIGSEFPMVLINKRISAYNNTTREYTVMNEEGIVAIAVIKNNAYLDEIIIREGSISFYSTKSGTFEMVNEVRLELESVDDMLTVDDTQEGRSDWMKARYWKVGQTRKVKYVGDSYVNVPVFPEVGTSVNVTFHKYKYKEFICVGYSSNPPDADTISLLMPADTE